MDPTKLLVLWTTDNRDVALHACFMYTYNAKAKGWWDEVCLLIWGPSGVLLSKDQELQDEVKKMMDAGIKVIACKSCSDRLGVTEALVGLGINVYKVGEDTSKMLQEGWKALTY
jgi:hypothetical protein